MRNRARGCLLGQVVGDAFGSQVEFKKACQIKDLFPDGITDMDASLTWGTLPGQVTDDSEMALAMARSIVRNGDYIPDDVLQSYKRWFASDPFDCGTTIWKSLHGEHNSESQANGALMRASPLGIWGARKSPEYLWEAASRDARMTHDNPVCVQVNQIFVTLLANAVRTGMKGDLLYADLCLKPSLYCEHELLPAVKNAIAIARDEKPVLDASSKGWVLLALRNALYQMIHAESFEQGVADTVMAGGDTDTNAAICGALLGAIYGADAIPQRWADVVLACQPKNGPGVRYPRPAEYWACDVLDLADTLVVQD